MTGTCKICGGSGWLFSEQDGHELATLCSCQKELVFRTQSAQANIPPLFHEAELKGYFPRKDSPSQEKAKKICQRFVSDYPAVTKGLMLQGPTGVGKTRLLCSIGNMLIKEKNAELYYIDWNDLLREFNSVEKTGFRDLVAIDSMLARVVSVDLLLFDEFGATRPNSYAQDNLYYLVNQRYNQHKITLFATNCPDRKNRIEDELLVERVGERIRSRLYEMTDAVEISGMDYRKEHG